MHKASTKKKSYTDLAYQVIKRRVLDNEFPAGSQYLEQEIAAQLNMSRTPVREALLKLSNEGLVEVIPRRGVRILPLSGQDMADIYLILTGLEAAAAEYCAAKGLDASQLEQLKKPLEEMDTALQQGDLNAWATADECFHKKLVELTDNHRLISMVELLWDQSHRARMITLKLRPKPTQSNNDHRALVQAIVDQNPQAAWRLHSDHRKKSGAMLVELLEHLGLNQL